MSIFRALLPAAVLLGAASCSTPPAVPTAAPVTSASFEPLFAELQRALAAEPRLAASSDFTIINLRQTLAASNFRTAEQLLTTLRRTTGDLPAATATLDRILALLRERRDAADRAIEAKLKVIQAETHAKVVARAGVKDFDALLDRVTRLTGGGANGIYPGYTDNPQSGASQALRNFLTRWQNYLVQTERGQFDQAALSLNDLLAGTGMAPIVSRSELLAIQTEALGRLEQARAARADKSRAQINRILKNFPAIIDGAHAARELDAVLAELATLRSSPDSFPGGYSAAYREVNDLIEHLQRFARRWQDYLGQVAANNSNAAQSIIANLSNDPGYERIYPRSLLIERANALKAASKPTP